MTELPWLPDRYMRRKIARAKRYMSRIISTSNKIDSKSELLFTIVRVP